MLKATPKGRKILILADNSDYAYVDGVRLLRTLHETTVFVASSSCYLAGLKALPCRIYKPSQNMR